MTRTASIALLALMIAGLATCATAETPPLFSSLVFDKTAEQNAPEEKRPRRTVVCPKVRRRAMIDGKLDDACWAKSRAAEEFVILGSDKPATRQTGVRVAHSETHFFVAYECLEKDMDKVRALVAEPDGEKIWRDDCVELFLDPLRQGQAFYQWIVNANAARWDMRALDMREPGAERPLLKTDVAWNSDADVAAARGKDRWTVEMAIPFASLGLTPKEGDVWGVNFNRHQILLSEQSNWAGLSGKHGNLDAEGFGNLLFGNAPVYIQDWDPGKAHVGVNTARIVLRSLSDKAFKGKLILKVEGGTKSTKTVHVPAGESRTAALTYTVPDKRRRGLDLELVTGWLGRCVAGERLTFSVPPALRCRLSSEILTANAKDARLHVSLFVGGRSLSDARVELSIASADGAVLRQSAIEDPKSPRFTGTLDLEGLAKGDYRLTATVMLNDRVVGDWSTPVRIIADPFDF